MKSKEYSVEKDGFYGVYYPCEEKSGRGLIVMLGDSPSDRLASCGAKWMNKQGLHVVAMAPAKKDYGHHNYPLERFEKAIGVLKENGCTKIGIAGASTTGMLALIAASYYPDITLTVAMSPSDFVMEGFYRDGKDGAEERPGDGESTVSYKGEPLPYLPFAYRHPDYWKNIQAESKETGNKIASRRLFDESERLHPLTEKEKIKIERIRGKVILIGAEDDALWDTCRYIRRMEKRLKETPHECELETWIYEHGTHFVFPESLLNTILPVGASMFVGLMFKAGKEYKKECRETRIDIDQRLKEALKNW